MRPERKKYFARCVNRVNQIKPQEGQADNCELDDNAITTAKTFSILK